MKSITLHLLLVFGVAVQCHPHLVKHVLEETDKTIKGISKVVTGGLLGGVNFNFHGQVAAMSDVQQSEQTTKRSGLFGLANLFHHQPPKPQEQQPGPEHQDIQMGYGYHHGHHRPPPHYGEGHSGGHYGNNQYGGQGNRPNNQYGHHGGQQPSQEYNPNGQYTPNNQGNGQYGLPGQGPGYNLTQSNTPHNQYGQGNRPNNHYGHHGGQQPSQEYNPNGQNTPNNQENGQYGPPGQGQGYNPTEFNTPHNQYGQGSNSYNQHGTNYGHRPPPGNNHYGHSVNGNQPGNNGNQQGNNGNQQGNNGDQQGNNGDQQGNQGVPDYQNNNGVKEMGLIPQRPSTESPKGGNDVALSGDQYVYGADGIKVKEPGADQDVDDFSIDIRAAFDKE